MVTNNTNENITLGEAVSKYLAILPDEKKKKDIKNRVTTYVHHCMFCNSKNISELIQNPNCKNVGLTWKEVMNKIIKKNKHSNN